MFGTHTQSVGKILVVFGAIISVFFGVKTINEIKNSALIGRDVGISNSITVTGMGEEMSTPDIATLSFGVKEEGKTVAVAQKQVTEKMNKALEYLEKEGIDKKDIATENYNFYPDYEYTNGVCTQFSCAPGKQVLKGYKVSHSVLVKIRNIEKAGEILSGVGEIGVQNLSGLNFTIDKKTELERKARQKAIKEAYENAERLAKDLGVRIVRLVSFNENNGGYPMPFYATKSARFDSVESSVANTPNIPTGESKISSNVTLTFEIR